MSTSDLINIVSCILTFFLSFISIVIVVITLKQNNKMIQNSSRPYVVAVGQIVNFQEPSLYLIIKNYGKSGATINKVRFSIDLKKYSYAENHAPFSKISDTFIAPNQSLLCSLDRRKMKNDDFKSFDVNIEYTDGIHMYSGTYIINFEVFVDNVQTRASTDGKELKIISYVLQDLVEKQI